MSATTDPVVPNFYETLGVAPGASADEVKHAYRRRARMLHPDRHANSPEEVVREANASMAKLNEAWKVLGDSDRRADYDRLLAAAGGAESPAPLYRDPTEHECQLCGSTPAVPARFRSETGKIIWRTRRWLDGWFCRDCGLAVFREMTNRTLITGWWGVLSFFVNWLTLARNVFARAKVARLSPPQSRDPLVVTPLSGPLSPGASLFARPGVYVAAVVLVVFGVVVANSDDTSSPNAPTVPLALPPSVDVPTVPVAPSFLLNGACLDLDAAKQRIDDVVACDGSEDAEVVAVQVLADFCPATTDLYFEGDVDVLCVALR